MFSTRTPRVQTATAAASVVRMPQIDWPRDRITAPQSSGSGQRVEPVNAPRSADRQARTRPAAARPPRADLRGGLPVPIPHRGRVHCRKRGHDIQDSGRPGPQHSRCGSTRGRPRLAVVRAGPAVPPRLPAGDGMVVGTNPLDRVGKPVRAAGGFGLWRLPSPRPYSPEGQMAEWTLRCRADRFCWRRSRRRRSLLTSSGE